MRFFGFLKYLTISMEHLGVNEVKKSKSKLYTCELCDYNSCQKANYEKHLLTPKHIKRETEVKCPHKCSCGKVFTRIDNLNRHKKNCKYEEILKAKVSKVSKSIKSIERCS
jgi:hypothetical protein